MVAILILFLFYVLVENRGEDTYFREGYREGVLERTEGYA